MVCDSDKQRAAFDALFDSLKPFIPLGFKNKFAARKEELYKLFCEATKDVY